MNRSVSIDRLQEIAEEVMAMPGDFAMDARLRELMMGRHSHECIELAMYLRVSCGRQSNLPTWQPLLNAAIELAMMRNEPVADLFFGMMPNVCEPQRNTG